MIVLSDNDLEIGIYPGKCIEAKDIKTRTERTIKWGEVKKSNILRYLTENLMSRLTYELNGYSGMIFGYEQIEEESRPITMIARTDTEPDTKKELTPKLFLKSSEVEEIYGISAGTLANWRSEMRGPRYHKVGGVVRYKVEDVDKYMESKKVRFMVESGKIRID